MLRIKDRAVRFLVNAWNPMTPREMLRRLKEDDRGGMSTEMVIIVAIVVIIAVGVVTYIGTQITNKAHGIHF